MKTLADFNPIDVKDVRGCVDLPYDDYTLALRHVYEYFLAVAKDKQPNVEWIAAHYLKNFARYTDDEKDYTTSVNIATLFALEDARIDHENARAKRFVIFNLIKAAGILFK